MKPRQIDFICEKEKYSRNDKQRTAPADGPPGDMLEKFEIQDLERLWSKKTEEEKTKISRYFSQIPATINIY